MSDDWLLRKQTQLLQDLLEAKSVSLELLDNLTILVSNFLSQAVEKNIEVANRDAISHLVKRARALLECSDETSTLVLSGRPPDKLPM